MKHERRFHRPGAFEKRGGFRWPDAIDPGFAGSSLLRDAISAAGHVVVLGRPFDWACPERTAKWSGRFFFAATDRKVFFSSGDGIQDSSRDLCTAVLGLSSLGDYTRIARATDLRSIRP